MVKMMFRWVIARVTLRRTSHNTNSGDIPNIFPTCSGVDSTGWPIELPGLGVGEQADFERCHLCQEGTWQRYGGLPFCKRHALQALASQGGPITLPAGCDGVVDGEGKGNHKKGENEP
jgi:hypothetical protein